MQFHPGKKDAPHPSTDPPSQETLGYERELARDRAIDAHSVNCIKCGKLVDERECMPGNDFEGDVCPSCQDSTPAEHELGIDLQATGETMADFDDDGNRLTDASSENDDTTPAYRPPGDGVYVTDIRRDDWIKELVGLCLEDIFTDAREYRRRTARAEALAHALQHGGTPDPMPPEDEKSPFDIS